MCGSGSRTEGLLKCLEIMEDAILSVQAGILPQTETNLPFVKSSFKNKSLLLGFEDS